MGEGWAPGEPPPVRGYALTDDPGRVDVDVVHAFLTESYWAKGVSRETVAASIRGSWLCVSLLAPDGSQAGFARAISDGATFAWIADVFVLEGYRGRGLGVWLVRELVRHPRLRGLRRVVLATRDAHELYRRLGFDALPMPERWMQLRAESRGGRASRAHGGPSAPTR